MEKKNNLKTIMLYCIPLFIQVIIHILVSSGLVNYANHIPGRIFAGVIITGFALLLGEGYGAIAFVVAGCVNRIVAYIVVIACSVIGAGASLVGYMMSGIEGQDCLWMTAVFWCIDLFLIVFSITRIAQLANSGAK